MIKRNFKIKNMLGKNYQNLMKTIQFWMELINLVYIDVALFVPVSLFFLVAYAFKTFIKQVDQGKNGIYERLGKYVNTVGAGMHFVNPCKISLI